MATDEIRKHERPVLCLMGPTASGKTDIAVSIHDRLPVEIVSVDSAMVYRDLDIGTAKPGPEILKRAPHRLVDICDPAETYSAARFYGDALTEIREIHAAGRIPLLVGGTGLYFRTLEQGLSELPEADPEIRRQIEQEAAKSGWKTLHERLAAIDPAAANRIHANDPQRIQRALEVYYLTGRPISAHFNDGRTREAPWLLHKLVLCPGERRVLHERIESRFHAMLEEGFVHEVENLYRRPDLHPGLPSMKLVGYREAWKYLAGELDYPSMIAQAVVATRQLAKRQLTWLRSEMGTEWFDTCSGGYEDKLLKTVEKIAKKTG